MRFDFQRFVGSEQHLMEKYRELYGEGNYEDRVSSHQKKTLKRYLIISVLFGLIILYAALGGSNEAPDVEIQDGRIVSVERPEEGEDPVLLEAKIWATSEDVQVGQEKRILIVPRNAGKAEEAVLKEEPESAKLERRIGTVARSLNQDTTSQRIVLPTKLEDGTRLTWQQIERSSSPILIFIFSFTIFSVYRSRYDGIKAEEKAARSSVIRELPEFINKLVLLLNGGIVMQGAMEKIIEDEEKLRKGEGTYFYQQLRAIYQKSRETNAQLHVEFYRFAKRSRVQELMRIAGIITDNISKGSDLAVKLQRESEMLWFARKKQSEEKGRIAETKMTLPLVILLLVLVMITIAPALMEM